MNKLSQLKNSLNWAVFANPKGEAPIYLGRVAFTRKDTLKRLFQRTQISCQEGVK
jgi:hypothetical protein